ncbi:MAG: tetratricopeptide repeat protein [Proteobacteria bacterium]|nr:tetratricopeptide repeat protein [Pseudomonadota bacterium]
MNTFFKLNFLRMPATWFAFLVLTVFLAQGCGGAITSQDVQTAGGEVLSTINAEREANGLSPLQQDEILSRTAQELADAAAKRGTVEEEENRLPALIAQGSFARFAMSHEILTRKIGQVTEALINDPIAKSKILHGRLTHMGIGFTQSGAGVFTAIDLARVVPAADLDSVREDLVGRVELKRSSNSVEHLEFDKNLDDKAAQIAKEFIDGVAKSDELIARTQREMSGENFSLGRVTITFQVVGDVNAAVIPSRTSDPALAYAGLGLAQGNHPDHEPGSLVVVLFLAEPQTAHDARRQVSDLPPPKSAPRDGGSNEVGSFVDRAWVATLSGSHGKAAALFKRAYEKKKDPSLLYEAARAYARDEDLDSALATMQKFAGIAKGQDKKKALEMIALLKSGKSIFSKSEKQKMSVEAKRFFLIGQRLFEQGEWDGAIDAFQQAYTYTKHPDIIYNIGLAHCRAGRVGDALAFFDEYQKYVPEVRSVEEARQLFEIGIELYRTGQFEAAAGHFAMSYAFLPFPELVYNLALCHKAMGQKDEALRFLRELLDGDPPKKDRAEIEEMISELSPKSDKVEETNK